MKYIYHDIHTHYVRLRLIKKDTHRYDTLHTNLLVSSYFAAHSRGNTRENAIESELIIVTQQSRHFVRHSRYKTIDNMASVTAASRRFEHRRHTDAARYDASRVSSQSERERNAEISRGWRYNFDITPRKFRENYKCD